MKGEENKKFVDTRLDKLWNHYDVLGDGFVEVERVPPLLR